MSKDPHGLGFRGWRVASVWRGMSLDEPELMIEPTRIFCEEVGGVGVAEAGGPFRLADLGGG